MNVMKKFMILFSLDYLNFSKKNYMPRLPNMYNFAFNLAYRVKKK